LTAKTPLPAMGDFFTVRGYFAPPMVFFIQFLDTERRSHLEPAVKAPSR
jgi:hypothetical protein